MASCFTNVDEGIIVNTHPYPHVPIGNELGPHNRLTFGNRTPPPVEQRDIEGMQFKRAVMLHASLMRAKPKLPKEGEDPKKASQKERFFLIEEREDDRHTALLYAILPSGYHGDAVISVFNGAQIVTDRFVPHSMRSQSAGVSHHVLALMTPGGELRGRATGHRIKPCYRWIYDGKEIVYIDGGEDIFVNENMISSNPPQP